MRLRTATSTQMYADMRSLSERISLRRGMAVQAHALRAWEKTGGGNAVKGAWPSHFVQVRGGAARTAGRALGAMERHLLHSEGKAVRDRADEGAVPHKPSKCGTK